MVSPSGFPVQVSPSGSRTYFEDSHEDWGSWCGVDESQYSPSLVGDCVVAALWLPKTPRIRGVDDSKRLTKPTIYKLFGEIQSLGVYAVTLATVSQINRLNVYKSRNKAIGSAIDQLDGILTLLGLTLTQAWVDGNEIVSFRPESRLPINYLVAGDHKSYLIGAASIVARTYADMLDVGAGSIWSGYGFEKDHGSPSAAHKEAFKSLGPSPWHRQGVYGKEWRKKLEQGL